MHYNQCKVGSANEGYKLTVGQNTGGDSDYLLLVVNQQMAGCLSEYVVYSIADLATVPI